MLNLNLPPNLKCRSLLFDYRRLEFQDSWAFSGLPSETAHASWAQMAHSLKSGCLAKGPHRPWGGKRCGSPLLRFVQLPGPSPDFERTESSEAKCRGPSGFMAFVRKASPFKLTSLLSCWLPACSDRVADRKRLSARGPASQFHRHWAPGTPGFPR